MSKHFCACVGACACDHTPLLKRPDGDGNFSIFTDGIQKFSLELNGAYA